MNYWASVMRGRRLTGVRSLHPTSRKCASPRKRLDFRVRRGMEFFLPGCSDRALAVILAEDDCRID